MARRIRTPRDLQKASNWLIYEYWMLEGLTRLLFGEDELTEIGLLRNAVLESFLIHARALVDFFYGKPKRKEDVSALDYFEGAARLYWEQRHPGKPTWFADTRERINKGVAHISYERHKDTWDFTVIKREISNTVDEFVRRVSSDLLGFRWEETKENMRSGSEPVVVLPPFLERGGTLKTSFYTLPNPDWYPDAKEED